MPDESTLPPETPPPYDPARRVGIGLAGETTRSEGSAILPDANPRPLEVIGDFEVLGKLGQGGMGAVYRARQISLDRQVALKILPPSLEADPEFVNRFQREARLAASLTQANLVKVYSSGVADGCHYIAMELIEGETLSQWVRRGALPPTEALRITLDVARALEFGWRKAQLIHRDIKPGNIFLSVEGEVKLGDLGLAKIIGGDTTGLTHTGTAMGTPHYISPEQARGDSDLDFRADIYSLGCTLFQMLTKQTPYSGHEPMVVMNQHINAPPPAILKVMPQCPLPLGRLVSKMLKKQRRERYSSYEELIAAIESVRATLDPTLAAPAFLAPSRPEPITPLPVAAAVTSRRDAPIQRRPGGASPPATKRVALYGGIGAGALALGIAAFFLWPKEEKLTKAQMYSREHASEQQAGGESNSASPASSARSSEAAAGNREAGGRTDSAGLEPGAIKLWDAPEKIPQREGVSWEDGALRLDGSSLTYAASASHDATIRASIRMNPDQHAPNLCLRARALHPGGDFYALCVYATNIQLSSVHSGKGTVLHLWPLPHAYGPDEWLRVELRAIGDEMTVAADGQTLGSIHDTSQPEAGGVQLYATAKGYFRDVVYVPLDRPGAASLPAQPRAKEPWQDVLRDPAKLVLSGGAERTAEGLRFTDAGQARLPFNQGPQHGGAVRMLVTRGGLRPELFANGRIAGYRLNAAIDGKKVSLVRYDNAAKANIVVREFPLREPLQPAQDYELELRVVGETFTAKLNGEVLGTVTDGMPQRRDFSVGVIGRNAGPALVKALEVLDLDPSAQGAGP